MPCLAYFVANTLKTQAHALLSLYLLTDPDLPQEAVHGTVPPLGIYGQLLLQSEPSSSTCWLCHTRIFQQWTCTCCEHCIKHKSKQLLGELYGLSLVIAMQLADGPILPLHHGVTDNINSLEIIL